MYNSPLALIAASPVTPLATTNFLSGSAVPIPTLPDPEIRILSAPWVWNIILSNAPTELLSTSELRIKLVVDTIFEEVIPSVTVKFPVNVSVVFSKNEPETLAAVGKAFIRVVLSFIREVYHLRLMILFVY